MHKEVRELIRWAGQYGWAYAGLAGNDSHPVLRHKSGIEYPLAGTPSDWRTLKNARSDLLRLAGEGSDSGPAGKYRKGLDRKRQRFDMDAAVQEIEDREVHDLCRLVRMIELQCRFHKLADEVSGLHPRLDKVQTVRLAHELRTITEELKILGAETPVL